MLTVGVESGREGGGEGGRRGEGEGGFSRLQASKYGPKQNKFYPANGIWNEETIAVLEFYI